jgi:ATP-dependent protease ClpP protease subunit
VANEEKKLSPLVEGLMNRRAVLLNGKITSDIVSEVGERLLTLQMRSADRINLVINSGGGSVYGALQLCDLMGSVITAPVHGIALGTCGSAATFVMLHCAKRLSTPYSRFLIHSGTRSEITVPINQTSSEHLEQLLKDVKATEEIVTRLYMNRLTPKAWANSNPSEEEKMAFVQELISRGDQPFDQWFSAEHALEIGLIQEITTAKLEIFPQEK